MISETVLLWIGTIALLTDYAGVARASDSKSRALAFVFSLAFWLAFTMNALAYIHTSGGTVYRHSSRALGLIGLFATAITLLLLVEAAFTAIKEGRNQST